MRTRFFMVVTAWGVVACGGGSRERTSSQSGGTPAVESAAAPARRAAAATPASGQAVFGRTCVTCHQANGQGMPNAFPPLAGSPFVAGEKARLIRLVLNGLMGPVTVAGKRFDGVMPPWKQTLSDAEIAAVLTYVRSSFGNRAGPVTADEVRQERAATQARSTPWTMPELERTRN